MPRSIEQFACALNALQCGALVLDRAGRMVHVNGPLAAMFGRPASELIGRDVAELYPREHERERIRRQMERFDEPAEFEFRVPRADGSTVPVIVSGRAMPSENGDGPHYRVVTVIDITEQKRATEELTHLSDTILEQALELNRFNKTLTRLVDERTRELNDANVDAIYMLAVASEAKDEATGAHVRRMQKLTEAIARHMGLPDDEATALGYSAILHDVGKMRVPDAILKKPGPLTAEERRIMQAHTTDGESILSTRPFFDLARQIARSHHENHDGSGYPDGLAGDAIPLAARVVHLVDVYDALIHARPYKKAWPIAQAVANIRAGAGTMFDPDLVVVFSDLHERGALEG